MRRLIACLVALATAGLLVGCRASSATLPSSATLTAASGGAATTTDAAERVDPESGLPWVAESALPKQARATLALIRKGGPYPYPNSDDKTFGNVERLLPQHKRGYYREYTVKKPGESDRGPWRIVTGKGGEKYWTPDHYASFQRIKENT